MEELLEMMSKKEVAKIELENLRTEIETHHNFLKSLKKLHEETLNRPLDFSTRRSPDNNRRPAQPRRSQEAAVASTSTSSSASVASVVLPDLINHESGRGGGGGGGGGAAVALNSPEYLYYLHQQKQLLSMRNLELSKHSQPQLPAGSQFPQISPVPTARQSPASTAMPPPAGQFSTNIQKFLGNSDIQQRLRPQAGGVTSLQLPGGAVGVPVPPSDRQDRQPAKSLTIRPRDFCREVPPSSSPASRRSPVVTRCAVCHNPANFLCSGCQKVYYCTVKCQVTLSPNIPVILSLFYLWNIIYFYL